VTVIVRSLPKSAATAPEGLTAPCAPAVAVMV
jgi:hypothetical protein